jgi:aryl-alcohol dehydrogenase-like predicted oxidoreductase
MTIETPGAASPGVEEASACVARSLDRYRLLGRSGLRVSPLALGTMTFGADWGWGADDAEARRLFDAYVGSGGNFIDTANNYTDGTSERLVGEFASGRRDQLVIATKYTCWTRRGDPNSGGNHRKSMIRSVESSLRRLRTDYIDLLYLHLWDGTTPVEEIMRGLDDLVRSGKVLYVGISDTPAWQVSRMQTLAELRGWAPLVALEVEYSLIERTSERDLLPMAREMGLGVLPWAALAKGVLTGKYTRADLDRPDPTQTRKNLAAAAGVLSERGLTIAEAVCEIAAEIGHTPSQVALAWTLRNPAVTAPIVGARTLPQLEDNLGALEVTLTSEQLAALENASGIDLGFPHELLLRDRTRRHIFDGTRLEAHI